MTGSAPDPLANLLSTSYPPAFVHLHHPHHPTTAITPLSGNDQDGRTRRYAQVDLIELSTPKLLYSAIVHRLAGASTSESRANGGENREVSTWDDFAIRLREVLGGQKAPGHARRKIAGGASADSGMDKADQAVVMITHAERLRTILGPRWAAMTRIRELSGLPITLITASHQTWDHLRPFAADAPEPVHVYLPALSRTDLLSSLTPRQNLISAAEPTADDLSNPFVTGSTSTTKTGHPLWPHFCNLLLATFSHLAPTSAELSYIAEPLWVLYTANLPPHAEQDLLRTSRHTATTTSNGTSGTSIVAPLDITVKLLTDLKYAISPAFTNASESLLSGTVGRTSFLSSLMPTSALTGDLDNPLAGPSKRTLPRAPSLTLPYIAKFLLIASYLASQNPPRTDLRLFGRGLTVEGKRKKGGGTRRAGYGRVKVGKVPQRLVGPKPFPLERGLAIWSALYAENGRRPMDLEQDDAFSGSEDEDIEDRLGEEDGTDAAGPPTPSKRRHGANSAGFILPALPGSTTKARRIRDEDWMYSRAERESKRAERKRKRQIEKEERWEEYVEEMSMSVALWGLVPDLEAQGLIKRVSPAERLDNVQLRCEIGYEAAVGLAKEVGITLDEYLYEAQA